MSIRKRMGSCPVHREAPEGFSLSEVEVRLATPEERPLWDALMDEHHYLSCRRLAGRGLRYVATFGGRWLGLAAWQKHTVAYVLTVHVLAALANIKGCLAAAQFARSPFQEELEAVGAWLNLNHRQRDCVFGGDACLTRTGHGPANRASLNKIALAVIFASRREAESLAETRRRPQLNRSDAIAALTRP